MPAGFNGIRRASFMAAPAFLLSLIAMPQVTLKPSSDMRGRFVIRHEPQLRFLGAYAH
jgi:hypothetical protein